MRKNNKTTPPSNEGKFIKKLSLLLMSILFMGNINAQSLQVSFWDPGTGQISGDMGW
jgi:hypothetical protein